MQLGPPKVEKPPLETTKSRAELKEILLTSQAVPDNPPLRKTEGVGPIEEALG